MTAESSGMQETPANLFDRIVSRERSGDAPRKPASLRPRIPYPFDGLPLKETPVEDDLQVPAVLGSSRDFPPTQLRAPLAATIGGADPKLDPGTQMQAPDPRPVLPSLTLHAAATSEAVSKAPPIPVARAVAPNPATASTARTIERAPEKIPVTQDRAPVALERVIVERSASHAHDPETSPPRSVPRQGTLRSRPEIRAVTLPPVIAASPEPIIEIRIGRIDVRAQAVPPVQPPVSRTDPSMPDRLTPYLGRRMRGARS